MSGGRGGCFRFNEDGSDSNGWGGLGGYMTAKKTKLAQQFNDDAARLGKVSALFENVAIYVNGYTLPVASDLKRLIGQHGGQYHVYYSRKHTTHIIATSLAGVKLKNLRPDQKVVRPEWLVDCVEAGSLLPIKPYILAAHGITANQKSITGMFQPVPSTSGINRVAVSSPENTSQLHSVKCTNEEENEDDVIIDIVENESSNATTVNLNNSSPQKGKKFAATSDPSFLSEFYANSRLHFLSTWRIEMADYVRSLSTAEDHQMTGYDQLMQLSSNQHQGERFTLKDARVVVHLDMDCFFVSAGLLTRPHLRGFPVAVTHRSNDVSPPGGAHHQSKSTDSAAGSGGDHRLQSDTPGASYSEIACCSYEARSAGVKNGMFFGRAKKLCPNLIAIPYEFEAYKRISRRMYAVVASYTRAVKAISCDDVIADVTELVRATGLTSDAVVEHMRATIRRETGCSASAGAGPNMTVARMATSVGKPNGQHCVNGQQASNFLTDQPVRNLPGVGRATACRLEQLGAGTCGELRALSLERLRREFGVKSGLKLHQLSRGVDNREVEQNDERKSVSADVNYGIRMTSHDEVTTFLSNLAIEVAGRMKRARVRATKLTLKLMLRLPQAPSECAKFGGHGACRTVTRSNQLALATDDAAVIAREASTLLRSLNVKVEDLRGIGIQMTSLEHMTSSPAGSKRGREKSSIASFIDNIRRSHAASPLAASSKATSDPASPASSGASPTLTSSGAGPSDAHANYSQAGHVATTSSSHADHVATTSSSHADHVTTKPPKCEANTEHQTSSCEQQQADNGYDSDEDLFASEDQEERDQMNVEEISNGVEDGLSAEERLFLSSLPEEIRREVEEDMQRQRSVLIGLSLDVAALPQPMQSTVTTTTATNTEARANHRHAASTSSKKTSTRRKVKTRRAKKKLNGGGGERAPSDGSKKISEIFNVVKKSKGGKEGSSQSSSSGASQLSVPSQSVVDYAAAAAVEVRKAPTLGGERTVSGARNIVKQWGESFADSPPLDRDVDDVARFVTLLIAESRDLEGADLMLSTLRRVARRNALTTGWRRAYEVAVGRAQAAVMRHYDGAVLRLRSFDDS